MGMGIFLSSGGEALFSAIENLQKFINDCARFSFALSFWIFDQLTY